MHIAPILNGRSYAGIALPNPDELTASVTEWIEGHEDEAWSDLVQDIARNVLR